jgi:hypothetical protein
LTIGALQIFQKIIGKAKRLSLLSAFNVNFRSIIMKHHALGWDIYQKVLQLILGKGYGQIAGASQI